MTSKYRQADLWFGRWVRLRDSFANASKHPYIRCFTCDAIRHAKAANAAHFITKTRIATRYTEKNVYTTCRACNMPGAGEAESKRLMALILVDEMGYEKLQELESESLIPADYDPIQLKEIAQEYKMKCAQLADQKEVITWWK